MNIRYFEYGDHPATWDGGIPVLITPHGEVEVDDIADFLMEATPIDENQYNEMTAAISRAR